MLILSRRPNETIRFPQLGISVSIVSVKGSRVQVGIDAPPEIQILRRELESEVPSDGTKSHLAARPVLGQSKPEVGAGKDTHELRNRLNKATLGLHLAQKQLANGQIEAADQTLAMALSRLTELEESQRAAVSAESTESSPSKKKALSAEILNRPARLPVEHFRQGTEVVSNDERQSVDVLLVEDDPNEQALLRGLLEIEGYRVHTASNGHEAINCLDHIQPDFVLLDMLMPECGGRETLQRIRQIPAFVNLPIFAVSGSSPNSVGLAIGQDGLADWFPKPLNAPRLVQHLRERIASTCT